MTQDQKNTTNALLFLSIQNPERFLELIEIMCSAMDSKDIQDVDQNYYEGFIGLDNTYISYLIERTLTNFEELLSNAAVVALLNTDDKIFDFLRLFTGMFSAGTLALSQDHQLVFLKAVGDPPDEPTQKRIDAKIEECRPILIALYHDFIKYLNSQPLTEDQRRRLTDLQEKCEKHNIEGIFTDNATMTLQEMAMRLWKHGYTAFPTVESMIDMLEKNIEDTINGTNTPGAKYIFKWQVDFALSDPKGVPIPGARINELQKVVEQWIATESLQLVEDFYVGKYVEDDCFDNIEYGDQGDQDDNDLDDDLHEKSVDTASKKIPELNQQEYCEIHANTLRVTEHLSYVIEAALINCTGDMKYELSRLIDAIHNQPAYKISNGYLVTEQLYEALEYYTKSAHIEGASILSATIRKLWERIFDVSSGVVRTVDDQL